MRDLLPRLIPLALGCCTVLQAGLNRKVTAAWSLPAAVFFNACVFLVFAGGLYFVAAARSSAPLWDVRELSWWFVLPGIFGFFLVMGGPWAVARLGAAQTFVLIVCAQLVASLIWDWQVAAIAPTAQRFAGIALAVLGTVLACLS